LIIENALMILSRLLTSTRFYRNYSRILFLFNLSALKIRILFLCIYISLENIKPKKYNNNNQK